MLLHRLCAALGVMHPDHLQARLSNPQIADWLAYLQIEPFGPQIESWYQARLLADLRNYSPISKKRDWKPADFMPRPPPEPVPVNHKIRAVLGRMMRKPAPPPP